MLDGDRPLTPAAGAQRSRALVILLTTAAVVFGLDHLIKWLVVQHLAVGEQVPQSGPVTIHHIHNSGAAFGLFPGLQAVFLAVAVVVSVYIVVAGHRLGGPLVQVALGMVLGGAAANAVDRYFQGYVVDYVDLHRWPVFNLADACIVVGIIAAVLMLGQRPATTDRAT